MNLLARESIYISELQLPLMCTQKMWGGKGRETDRQQTDGHKDRERIAFFALLFPGLDLSLELYTGKLFLRRRDRTG